MRIKKYLEEKNSPTAVSDPAAKQQIAIARKTLKMKDIRRMIMGGMTKEEARAVLKKYGLKEEQEKCPICGEKKCAGHTDGEWKRYEQVRAERREKTSEAKKFGGDTGVDADFDHQDIDQMCKINIKRIDEMMDIFSDIQDDFDSLPAIAEDKLPSLFKNLNDVEKGLRFIRGVLKKVIA